MRIVPESREQPCGVVLDLCGFGIWRVPRGSRLELLGEADSFLVKAEVESRLNLRTASSQSASMADGVDSLSSQLATFEEAARRVGLSRKTLYEWKRTGKLRREHGLRMLGRSPRLVWSIFKDCIEKGEF
jgi:hypothetical protein